MNLGINGKACLVTGGSKGIGAEIVRRLAEEGAAVAFCARESQALRSLEGTLREKGLRVLAIPIDVTSPQGPQECLQRTVEAFGGLDVLVNNVGGAIRYAPFEDLEDSDWLAAFNLNVMPVVRFVRAAIPSLKRSSSPRIINISSISGRQPGAWNPHYTTTKAAVINLSKFLANSLASDGILVNTLCPGPVATEAWEANVQASALRQSRDPEEVRAEIERQESAKVPLRKIGSGRHVADAVCFLASECSNWTTGACLSIDGGKLAVTA